MKIGEVAAAAGVSIDTVRFYERRGVLPEPARRPSGYREYPDSIVERILLARRLQSVGLTLDEIVDALAAHDRGTATCESERWRLDVALGRVDERIAELRALRTAIRRLRNDCASGRCALSN
jgi:DNA-binding transcriptional MerR regulator